jgi:hypothetical protein
VYVACGAHDGITRAEQFAGTYRADVYDQACWLFRSERRTLLPSNRLLAGDRYFSPRFTSRNRSDASCSSVSPDDEPHSRCNIKNDETNTRNSSIDSETDSGNKFPSLFLRNRERERERERERRRRKRREKPERVASRHRYTWPE